MNGSLCTTPSPVPAVALRAARPSWSQRIEAATIGAVEQLLTWQDRARSRRMLRSLDDRMLRDIGVDRARALHEGARPFWKPYY